MVGLCKQYGQLEVLTQTRLSNSNGYDQTLGKQRPGAVPNHQQQGGPYCHEPDQKQNGGQNVESNKHNILRKSKTVKNIYVQKTDDVL